MALDYDQFEAIKKEFADFVSINFRSSLLYSFFSGSVSYGGGEEVKSDIDFMIVLDNDVLIDKKKGDQVFDKILSFSEFYLNENNKYGFVPDLVFPGEYVTEGEIKDSIAGRGFESANHQLNLSASSDEYFLANEEHWFRAWLSMQAFSVFCSGNKEEFNRNKKEAWKTIILYLLVKNKYSEVSPTIILDYLTSGDDKRLEVGITKDYSLLKAREMSTVKEVMLELGAMGYLTSMGDIYNTVQLKIDEWQRKTSDKIESMEVRTSEIYLDKTRLKILSKFVQDKNEKTKFRKWDRVDPQLAPGGRY